MSTTEDVIDVLNGSINSNKMATVIDRFLRTLQGLISKEVKGSRVEFDLPSYDGRAFRLIIPTGKEDIYFKVWGVAGMKDFYFRKGEFLPEEFIQPVFERLPLVLDLTKEIYPRVAEKLNRYQAIGKCQSVSALL